MDGGTEAPVVDFFLVDFAMNICNLIQPHLYLTGTTALKLRLNLPNMNVYGYQNEEI